MAENSEGLIIDVGLAWDVAYAEKPYLDVAHTARQVGLLGIAAEIEYRAGDIGQRVEEVAQEEGRMKEKLEESQAFSRLCDETEEDILTFYDFKICNQDGAAGAWQRLAELLTENPSPVIRLVEYSKSKYALVGNVAAAAKIIDDPTITPILSESARVIEALKTSGAQ